MQIGVVRVLVADRNMAVPMGVRFTDRIVRAVRMMVMVVVDVPVLVFQRVVLVFVLVDFGQMQVNPKRHQQPCCK